MTCHTTVRPDTQEHRAQINTCQGVDQDETLVEMTAQRLEPLINQMAHKKMLSSLSIKSQYGIALGSILIAVLVRLIADSYLGETLPFVTFLLAIAVTTWWGGIGASLTTLILGALLWNWFFVNPRYAFTMGSHVDQAGMAVYLTTGVAIIGYLQTWRWAWKQSEEMAEVLHRDRVLGLDPKAALSR